MKRLLILLLCLPLWCGAYTWKIDRVVDGDTVKFKVDWLIPELGNTISVRVIGIDTPEKTFLAKCDQEKALGEKASTFTREFLRGKKEATVDVKAWDKYGGRLLGSISVNGKDLATELVKAGLAREYNGGAKKSWCQEPLITK